MLGFPLTPKVYGFLLLIRIWPFFYQKLMKVVCVALQKLAQKSKFDQTCYLTRFGKAKPSYFHQFLIKKMTKFWSAAKNREHWELSGTLKSDHKHRRMVFVRAKNVPNGVRTGWCFSNEFLRLLSTCQRCSSPEKTTEKRSSKKVPQNRATG